MEEKRRKVRRNRKTLIKNRKNEKSIYIKEKYVSANDSTFRIETERCNF